MERKDELVFLFNVVVVLLLVCNLLIKVDICCGVSYLVFFGLLGSK